MRKLLSLILILLIGYTTVSCSSDKKEEAAKPRIDVVAAYDDVNEDDWYKDSVDWGVNEGIMSAAKPKSFGADNSMTQAQVLLAMWKSAGSPGQVISAKVIPDSDPNSDLSKAFEWAKLYNIIDDYEDLSDSKVINRLEAIVYMWKEAEKPIVQKGENFADAEGLDSVLWAKTNKITLGVGNNLFAPERDCTKAMMITFLFRAK